MDTSSQSSRFVQDFERLRLRRSSVPAAEPDAPLFFTKDEFALLDLLTELIIPTDAHSPGARAAGVAPFIDKMVAESITAEDKDSWRKGLGAIDEASNAKSKKPFVKAAKTHQLAILTDLAKKQEDPGTPAEKFFAQLKETIAFLYYSSSIGIHKEIEYKGNVLLQQFAGYDVS